MTCYSVCTGTGTESSLLLSLLSWSSLWPCDGDSDSPGCSSIQRVVAVVLPVVVVDVVAVAAVCRSCCLSSAGISPLQVYFGPRRKLPRPATVCVHLLWPQKARGSVEVDWKCLD